MSCIDATAVLTDDLALKNACENGNVSKVREILQRKTANINIQYPVR